MTLEEKKRGGRRLSQARALLRLPRVAADGCAWDQFLGWRCKEIKRLYGSCIGVALSSLADHFLLFLTSMPWANLKYICWVNLGFISKWKDKTDLSRNLQQQKIHYQNYTSSPYGGPSQLRGRWSQCSLEDPHGWLQQPAEGHWGFGGGELAVGLKQSVFTQHERD